MIFDPNKLQQESPAVAYKGKGKAWILDIALLTGD